MDVGADQSTNSRTEGAQRGDAPAASVQGSDRARPALFCGTDRVVKRFVHERSDRRPDPQPVQEGEAPGLGHSYQAVEVAASVIPSASSQRSASMAALQPSPAAVTAWR